MHFVKPRKSSISQHGIVLLEVMIAVLIFSVGILGLVGLQATVAKSTSDAQYRAVASNLVQQRIGEIWVDAKQVGIAGYGESDTNIAESSGLPNGKRTTTRADPSGDATCGADLQCFTVTVSWQLPGGDKHNVTSIARVQ